MAGKSLRWRFQSEQKRLSLTLPPEFGGQTHEVRLVGGYTLAPVSASEVAA
jgi:hypothetical protein